MEDITSKIQIISSLKDSNERGQNWFAGIPTDQFFTRQGEIWSASDNVDHMIRAMKPITKALKLPRMALQILFGKPENLSRTYNEICKIYREEIARGTRAGGVFLPNQDSPNDLEGKKVELLNQLSTTVDKLVSAVKAWNENHLDEAQLPHPLIGKLTIREMLFFTIYHNLRHASQEGD